MSKRLHSTDHLQIVLGMGIFPFYMTNLVLDNFNIISCTALIINCRLKFKWKPAGFYSDVWLKEQKWHAKFYLLKMEDSELCFQAANELGKETPVRFKIHLVSQITWIPTNQNKMVNAGKTKANKRVSMECSLGTIVLTLPGTCRCGRVSRCVRFVAYF